MQTTVLFLFIGGEELAIIFLNKFEIKSKELHNNGADLDLIEQMIKEDIKAAYKQLISKKEVRYNETEKTEMLLSQLKINKTWKEKYARQTPNLRDMFSDIYEENLTKWRWDEEPELTETEEGIQFLAGFHTDFIEINEFKGKFKAIPDTKFGSFRMTTGSPIGLIFIFSPYGVESKFRKVIKLILPPRDKLETIRWDNGGLRSILTEDSTTLKGLNASGIDGDVRVSASSPDLNSRPFSNAVNGGNYNGIAYESKLYPGNLVRINGGKGFIITDLEESVAMNYFKDILMKHAIHN